MNVLLTGLHLGDVPEMKSCSTHDLHVVRAHTEDAFAGLTHGGECLGHQLVERLAVLVALAQRRRLVLKFVIGELLEVVLERVHGLDDLVQTAKDATFAGAQQLVKRIRHLSHLPVVGQIPATQIGLRCRAYSAMLPARDLRVACTGHARDVDSRVHRRFPVYVC